ncbi:MAG: hypothetical protein ACJA05_000107 [Porticoccus sp.]|jgi:hypothetical protein|tara:strand:+ start:659 stop:784 length:126 start_codon:yes stop_codon:yes gene_type:complete
MSKNRLYTWADYEAAKAALPKGLSPVQRDQAIGRLLKEMGL